MKRKSQFPFVSSAAVFVSICGLLIANNVHYTQTRSLTSRFSDILRHGPLFNYDSGQRRSSSLLLSPFRYFTDVITDSEATESQNAGTLVSSNSNSFQSPSYLTSSSFSQSPSFLTSSSFSPPVTFTSKVQLPQFTHGSSSSIPNKEAYGYTVATTTPNSYSIQNVNHNLQNQQPVTTPVLLQPIVQYIIQLPGNPYDKQKNGNLEGQQQGQVLAEETLLGSPNLSKEIMEMMNEASKDMSLDSIASSASEQNQSQQPEPSTDNKMHTESVDNLISVIEHMNNVSDATVIENDSPQESSVNNQNFLVENNNAGYQNFLGNQNGGYSSLGNQISPPVTKQNENDYDYYSPNKNHIQNGFFNSPIRSFQPDPKNTEEAMSIFSHLSDQISRDLYSDHLSNIQYGYNSRQNSAKSYKNKEANSRTDPMYGDSSVYYTSYSNQRPPLDSEIYHTLKSILRNK